MRNPVRRDQSGNYYFRKAVPLGLRDAVGKWEIKVSLQTKQLTVAEPKNDDLHRHWDSVFQRLKTARVELTHKVRVGLAGLYYEEYLRGFESEPHTHSGMDATINGLVSRNPRRWGGDYVERKLNRARKEHSTKFKALLLAKGVTLTDAEFELVLPHVFKAITLADDAIRQYKAGNYTVPSSADLFPPIDLSALIVDADGVRLDLKKHGTLALFDKMAAERSFAAGTIKRHRPIIEKVAAVHPDIRSITPEWCVDWKDGLLSSGERGPSTVKQAYLAALNNLANFAVSNRSLQANPLTGLYLKVHKKKRNRTQKGFTEAEAKKVLAACLAVTGEGLEPDEARARRWLPWLCCYAGARIGEMAQLRKKDVTLEDGVWVLELLPEAGTIKTGEARRVPLHPHLIAQGFLAVLDGLADGYIFCPADGGRSPTTVADDLARWVRELGITDLELKPNHGWRHRFKTVARRVKMDPAVRDYMQGHVPHNESEGYGNQEAPILLEWLSLIKWIDVDGDPSISERRPLGGQLNRRPTLVWSR